MAKFLPPYQFIPFKAQSDDQLTPQDDISAGKTHIRHDLYHPKAHTGRIIARIDIKRPTVVGGQQEPGVKADHKNNKLGTPGRVEPYRTPQGDIAIPANSLRGVIGSTLETISNSALRVFDDQLFSTRKSMQKRKCSNGFPAIGILRDFNGVFKIQPVALLLIDIDTQTKQTLLDDKWFQVFKGRPLSECLGACISAYKVKDPVLRSSAKSFQLKHNIEYHYASVRPELSKVTLDRNFVVTPYIDGLNLQGAYMRGLKVIDSKDEFQYADSNNVIPNARRGILYVLGTNGREDNMPNTKKYEWFLPFPEDFHTKAGQLSLPKAVIDTFNAIAKSLDDRCKKNTKHKRRQQQTKPEQQSNYRPYLPAGYESHRAEGAARSGFSYWLADGDLVYFDVDEYGSEVTEIAYSNLWRQAMVYSSYELLNKNTCNGRNLLPWGSSDCNNQLFRTGLSIAESLLGVVADDQKVHNVEPTKTSAETNIKLKALSSRVRISDARAVNEVELLEATTLKVLASPKPPSPAMYLRTGSQEYVSRNNLVTTIGDNAVLNGRKHYWHHSGQDRWSSCVSTDKEAQKTIHQKLNVQPIKEGQSFYFHVDYANLSDDELALLLTSIQPQQDKEDTFYHHIGLGKPLGLGSISIHIEAVLGINHQQRYSELGLGSPLYTQVGTTLHTEDSRAWQQCYPREAQVFSSVFGRAQQQAITWNSQYIDKEVLAMVRLMGKPVPNDFGVCYPYTTTDKPGQKAYEEGEGFKWFVQNESKYHTPQWLQKLNSHSKLKDLTLDSTHQVNPSADTSRRRKK